MFFVLLYLPFISLTVPCDAGNIIRERKSYSRPAACAALVWSLLNLARKLTNAMRVLIQWKPAFDLRCVILLLLLLPFISLVSPCEFCDAGDGRVESNFYKAYRIHNVHMAAWAVS